MHKELLEEAFNKAKEETRSDRVTHLSKYLSDFIVEDSNEPYGERILRDHYNKIIKNSNEKIYLREHAAESLSHYLGFADFTDFINTSTNDKTNKKSKSNSFVKSINSFL